MPEQKASTIGSGMGVNRSAAPQDTTPIVRRTRCNHRGSKKRVLRRGTTKHASLKMHARLIGRASKLWSEEAE